MLLSLHATKVSALESEGSCTGVLAGGNQCPTSVQPVCNHSQTDCQHTTASLNAFCHFSGKSPATTSLFMGFHFKSKLFCLDSVNVNLCWFSQFLVIRSETDCRLCFIFVSMHQSCFEWGDWLWTFADLLQSRSPVAHGCSNSVPLPVSAPAEVNVYGTM